MHGGIRVGGGSLGRVLVGPSENKATAMGVAAAWGEQIAILFNWTIPQRFRKPPSSSYFLGSFS